MRWLAVLSYGSNGRGNLLSPPAQAGVVGDRCDDDPGLRRDDNSVQVIRRNFAPP